MGLFALQTGTSCGSGAKPAWGRQIGAFVGTVFMVTGAAISPAGSVDLVNRDRAPREVIVNHSDGRSETVKVGAGQRVRKICDDCAILAATTSAEAKGDVVVKIERGEVSIDGK